MLNSKRLVICVGGAPKRPTRLMSKSPKTYSSSTTGCAIEVLPDRPRGAGVCAGDSSAISFALRSLVLVRSPRPASAIRLSRLFGSIFFLLIITPLIVSGTEERLYNTIIFTSCQGVNSVVSEVIVEKCVGVT